MSDISAFVDARLGEWQAFRRNLHRHPERGFLEYRTQATLAERLEALGYELRLGREVMNRAAMRGVPDPAVVKAAAEEALRSGARSDYVDRMADGMTGLVAEIRNGNGPVVAMRFDVDALPLSEANDEKHRPRKLGFDSSVLGTMHACGHDGHAAIGLAVAELAVHHTEMWEGTFRLIFQPAEEGGRGALPMVEAGVVDDVDFFFALHLGCDLPSRQVAICASEMMFSAKWDVRFRGYSAHAAGNPESGQNALLVAAQATAALYALPRHGQYATHVNVGRLTAGSGRNVIADSAIMEIELRGGASPALEHMESRARAVIECAASAQGCRSEIEEMGRTIGARTSPKSAALIRDVAKSLSKFDEVLDEWPLGGGDDAAFFMSRIQDRGGEAAYLILGSDLTAAHHATTFDFNEAEIGVGAQLMYGLLTRAAGTGAVLP